MRYGLLAVALIGAATLGGCSEGVLDPKGPIAVAERQILFNSLGIMLAIVIPTILATLGVAFWFRASNERARYLPDFDYSGRLEMLVWSIPAMTVLLVGGVAWVGAHDLDPRKPIASTVKPVSVQVVSLDWKWLFIYPEQGIASVNQLTIPVGTPVSFELTSSGVMNSFFVPQLGEPDLHHGGNGDAPSPAGGPSWNLPGAVGAVQRRRLCRYALHRRCGAGRRLCAVGGCDAQRRSGARRASLCRSGQAERGGRAFHLSCRRSRSVQQHRERRHAAARSVAAHLSCSHRGQNDESPRQAQLERDPVRSADRHGRDGMHGPRRRRSSSGGSRSRDTGPICGASGSPPSTTSASASCICVLALIMLLRGFADAIMMRAQQAVAAGGAQGYLPPEHFDQIFSAHGTIMIFFMAMPFVIGLMNFVVPLQLGVRDMAFPTLNSVALWLTASGILLTNISLAVGEFAKTGWVAYPPLSELQFSPGVGVDYYLWALQISGIGTLLTGINFVTTILKTRAPGMGYMRMPVFCWTALASNLLIVAAFPVLTATFAMLLLDRYLGFHFFSIDGQGNPMMYVNLFWVWGHPEVYILILPAFGIFSEVIATFSGKPLFGYRSMVAATMVICVLSFLVWLHHFFTMGASANVNGFFGVMTMIIAVPTGVKVFNWLFTMYGGRVRFTVPVLWSIGFMVTFVIGGMTGVLMAVPPADFQLHNSLFLVAHFHNVIIGGVVFGVMAGYNYWFPKAFGFKLDERWGKASFWCWLIGFYLAFMPLYVLGLMGMTRRMQHYDNLAWQPWLLVAAVGAVIILAGIVCQVVQLVVSIRAPRAAPRPDRRIPGTAARWNGRRRRRHRPGILPSCHSVAERDALLEQEATRAGDSRISQRKRASTSRSRCRRTARPASSPPSLPSSPALR